MKRLEVLEAEEKVDGLGWNDPKTPKAKVERMLKRTKEMHDLKCEIARIRADDVRAGG